MYLWLGLTGSTSSNVSSEVPLTNKLRGAPKLTQRMNAKKKSFPVSYAGFL